jgi:peptidoglycan hydrolase FlgJ
MGLSALTSIATRMPLAASAKGDSPASAEQKLGQSSGDNKELHQAFNQFVGETFYGQMLKAMRKTQHKPAYFHGGRAEEVFQQQLDGILAEKMADASADKISGPMYNLFLARR